jgi:hypothetical protein
MMYMTEHPDAFAMWGDEMSPELGDFNSEWSFVNPYQMPCFQATPAFTTKVHCSIALADSA